MRIKNWKKFQHYQTGKRSIGTPEWIKLYHAILDDPEWFQLSDGASRLLVECWMIASEDNGGLPPLKTIAFRLRKKLEEVEALISELDHWLEDDASTVLADRYQPASAEEKREEREEKRREEKEALPRPYAWEGEVIKLDTKLHTTWKASFPHLDLDAELAARDVYLSSLSKEEKDRWIFSTSAYLRNRQSELKAKQKVKVVGKQFKEDEPVNLAPVEDRRRQADAAMRKMRERNALVCSDDQKPKRSSSAAAANGAGLRHVLSTLQGVDDTEEDQAERAN